MFGGEGLMGQYKGGDEDVTSTGRSPELQSLGFIFISFSFFPDQTVAILDGLGLG